MGLINPAVDRSGIPSIGRTIWSGITKLSRLDSQSDLFRNLCDVRRPSIGLRQAGVCEISTYSSYTIFQS